MTAAVRYLSRSDVAGRTALIGSFVVVLGDIFFPMVAIGGYLTRVVRRAAAADPDPPVFADWPRIAVDGSKFLGIWVALAAGPLVLVEVWVATSGITGIGAASTMLPGAVFGGLATAPVEVVLLTSVRAAVRAIGDASFVDVGRVTVEALWPVLGLAALSILLALYVLPASFARFSARRRLRAAFAVRPLARTLATPRYAAGWALSLGVSLVGWLVLVGAALYLDVPSFVAPLADRGSAGGSTLADLFAGDTGFASPLSFAVLPTYRVESPVLLGKYALFLAGALVFFYSQVAAFFLVGRTWATIPGTPNVLSDEESAGRDAAGTRGDRGPIARLARGGAAGIVGGILFAAFGLVTSVSHIVTGLAYTVAELVWLLVHPVLPIVLVLLTIALVRLYRRHRGVVGPLGTTGFLVAAYGFVVMSVSNAWIYWYVGPGQPVRDAPNIWFLNLVAWIVATIGTAILGATLWGRGRDRGSTVAGILVLVPVLWLIHFTLYLLDIHVLSWITRSVLAGYVLSGLGWAAIGLAERSTRTDRA